MNFNQDCSCLSIGSNDGYQLYNFSNLPERVDFLFKQYGQTITHVQRLFTSSLIFYVTKEQPKILTVYHFRKNTNIITPEFETDIKAIKLNRNRLIIILEMSIQILSIKDMSLIHIIDNFVPNRDCDYSNQVALAAPVSATALSNLVAYPTQETEGGIMVFDGYFLKTINIIKAHDNPISALAFCNKSSAQVGTHNNPILLASASERGTVIRVWNIPNGTLLRSLRRSYTIASVRQLTFSLNAKYLALITSTQTVHVFELDTDEEEPADSDNGTNIIQSQEITDADLESDTEPATQSWYEYISSLASSLISVTTTYSDLAHAYVSGENALRANYLCRLSANAVSVSIYKNEFILVTTVDMKLMVYRIDKLLSDFEVSGSPLECQLTTEIDLNQVSKSDPLISHYKDENQRNSYSSMVNKGGKKSRVNIVQDVRGEGPNIDDRSDFPALG